MVPLSLSAISCMNLNKPKLQAVPATYPSDWYPTGVAPTLLSLSSLHLHTFVALKDCSISSVFWNYFGYASILCSKTVRCIPGVHLVELSPFKPHHLPVIRKVSINLRSSLIVLPCHCVMISHVAREAISMQC